MPPLPPQHDYVLSVEGFELSTGVLPIAWKQTIAHPQGFPGEIAGFVLRRTTDQGKPVIGTLYLKSAYRRMGIGRQLLEHATGSSRDFVTVLAQPKVRSVARDRGLKPQLSPYFL